MTERLDAGQIVDGRYKVLNRLGSGGMADVYCAEDLQLGRKVALKVLYRRFAEDAEFVERFRREASSAAGLQHPNVVSVYDRGEWDGTSYIAMEYIEGRTLKSIVQQEAPLDPRRAGALVTQVLRAARFAHKRGVIHRDLKPHNVMVDAEDRAKVTDFGIAKAGASDMTQTGSIMGTAQYLSPEQAQGLPVSAASDLYSVGIILYELLTGQVPFDGESAVTIALKQVNETPAPASQLNPAVGPALDGVVARALAKDPARRFSDADEFIDALEQAESKQPVSAAATGATAVAAPPVRPIVPVAAPVPPDPITSSYDTGAYYPAEPLPPEPPRDRDSRPWLVALIIGLLVVAVILGILFLTGGKKVTVPAVTGAPQSDAQLALRKAGLSVEVVNKTSQAAKDTVISQDPPAGTKVDDGTSVTIVVSSGPGEAIVPDVTDLGRNAATKKLQDAGFVVQTTEETSDTVRKDHVIRTSPDAQESLEKGSTVRLYVSTGPEKVAVPNVVGQNIDDARATLTAAGFEVQTTQKEDDKAEAGTVLEQTPAAATQAAKESTVKLTVAKAPDTAEVPSVIGEMQDDATTTLSGAGFTVVTQRQNVTDPEQADRVLSQSPDAKTKSKKGSKVTIVVGAYTAPTTTTPTTTTPTDTAPTETTP